MQVLIIMMAIFTLLLMTADPRVDRTQSEQQQTSAWQQNQHQSNQHTEDPKQPSDDVEKI